MRARIAATAVLAVGLALGTAGCTFFTPQSTLRHYDPSDGVSTTVGDIEVRNAFAVTATGEDPNLVMVIINSSDSAETVKVGYGSGTKSTTIDVPANGSISYGNPGVPQLVLDGAKATPGALFPLFIQYGDETGKKLRIPVLDGTISPYQTLIPTPTPTFTPVPAATATPTSTATPAP